MYTKVILISTFLAASALAYNPFPQGQTQILGVAAAIIAAAPAAINAAPIDDAVGGLIKRAGGGKPADRPFPTAALTADLAKMIQQNQKNPQIRRKTDQRNDAGAADAAGPDLVARLDSLPTDDHTFPEDGNIFSKLFE
jgi:hypothetical protein